MRGKYYAFAYLYGRDYHTVSGKPIGYVREFPYASKRDRWCASDPTHRVPLKHNITPLFGHRAHRFDLAYDQYEKEHRDADKWERMEARTVLTMSLMVGERETPEQGYSGDGVDRTPLI